MVAHSLQGAQDKKKNKATFIPLLPYLRDGSLTITQTPRPGLLFKPIVARAAFVLYGVVFSSLPKQTPLGGEYEDAFCTSASVVQWLEQLGMNPRVWVRIPA